jgi:HSP20 family protein
MALLVKPEPFARDIDRLFNSVFGPAGSATQEQRFIPAMDLTEAGDHYVLRADLPGLDHEDVSIEVVDDTLTISGERKLEEERAGQGYTRLERSHGRFSRSLALPEGVDPDAVTAAFDRGVLEVSIPKPEERKPRRVSISVGNGRPAQVEGTASER